MSKVSVNQSFPGSVHAAETLWYDTSRWTGWVEGLEHIEQTTGDWPKAGSAVVWASGPAGRGRVTERVVEYEPRRGQSSEVNDDAIDGVQTVTFTPAGEDQVTVELALDYRIRKRSPFTPLVDLLFIRRAMRASLRATLARFGSELIAVRD